ncbi:MAG: RNA-binding protein [candidate division Zixibacteria bacterium]|nr:RNA-binding protein [candidate division Zixibacteria bacterium]
MQGSKLYVGNLSYSTTRESLTELFSEHGSVKEVNIIDGKGFGFVEMSSIEEAEKVQENCNGTELDGRTIKVDEAKPRTDKPRGNYGGDRSNRSYQRY